MNNKFKKDDNQMNKKQEHSGREEHGQKHETERGGQKHEKHEREEHSKEQGSLKREQHQEHSGREEHGQKHEQRERSEHSKGQGPLKREQGQETEKGMSREYGAQPACKSCKKSIRGEDDNNGSNKKGGCSC